MNNNATNKEIREKYISNRKTPTDLLGVSWKIGNEN